MQKFNKIFKNSIVVIIGILLSRLTGFARDIMFAKYLGSGTMSDIFFACFKIPNIFRKTLGEGAVSSVFIPIFNTAFKKDKKQSFEFAGAIFSLILISTIALSIIFLFFGEDFVKFSNKGFADNLQKLNATIKYSKIMFFFLIFASVSAFFGALGMCVDIFFYNSTSSALFNLCIVFFGFILNLITKDILLSFSIAVLISGFFQVIFCLYGLYKNGIKFKPNLSFKNENIKVFKKRFIPSFLSSSVSQINIFIDTIFCSFFEAATSYLYYADRIINLPLSLIGYTISTVLLPKLSNDVKFSKKSQILSFNISIVLSIPCIFGVFMFGDLIVKTLFLRGQFTDVDSQFVSKMICIYSISLPFNIISKIMTSYLLFQGKNKSLMIVSVVSLISNIVVNLTLYKTKIGMYCVVISLVVSSLVNFVLIFFANIRFKSFFLERKSLICVLYTIFVCIIVSIFVLKIGLINSFFGIFLWCVIYCILIFLKKSLFIY